MVGGGVRVVSGAFGGVSSGGELKLPLLVYICDVIRNDFLSGHSLQDCWVCNLLCNMRVCILRVTHTNWCNDRDFGDETSQILSTLSCCRKKRTQFSEFKRVLFALRRFLKKGLKILNRNIHLYSWDKKHEETAGIFQ